jgi:Uma2 family endonuclease
MIKAPLESALLLPNPLVLDFSAVEMTDGQFVQFCADNGDLRFELTAKRELIVMPPAGLETSSSNNLIGFHLTGWSRQDGSGVSFDSSAGFTFPNGAVRSPDASWVVRERWEALPRAERRRFAHLCPDFVAELRSPSDSLAMAQAKMAEYIENGVRLGWLIDPDNKTVHVYRPGHPVEVLEDPASVSGEAVLPGFELNVQEIW